MLRIATFNLNNLFHRINFAVELDHEPTSDELAAAALKVVPGENGIGQADGGVAGLVKAKPLAERMRLSERIRQLDADVLLVQEVEHRDALKQFNASTWSTLRCRIVSSSAVTCSRSTCSAATTPTCA